MPNCIERRSGKLSVVALISMTLYACCAQADDNSAPTFSFSGFGTLGLAHSSENKADFVGNFSQPHGAGYTSRWSPDVDSRVGAQVNADFNDKLSAVVQIVSQHDFDSFYTPKIEWANVKYQFTPELSVRAGRTLLATFMASDSRLVSYTNHWIRPPLEVYGMLPVSNKDGIDAVYQFHVGELTNSIQTSYGKTTLNLPNGGEVNGKSIFDFNDTLEYVDGTVHVGYTSLLGDVHSPSLDALFSGFTQFGNTVSAIPGLQATGAQALALANKYQLIHFPYSVFTLGAEYNPGTWLLMGEWANAKTSAAISNATAWYATGGYRFGSCTPYLTVAQLRVDKLSEPGISTAGLPAPLAATAAGLNAGLSMVINGYAVSQKTVSAGVRWDFMRSAAFKLQYDRLSLGAGSTGWLTNVQPGFQLGGKVNVLSIAVDFVF